MQGEDAYCKLITSAYLLAVDGQPLSTFKTIVLSQKANGVKLIEDCDNVKKAKECGIFKDFMDFKNVNDSGSANFSAASLYNFGWKPSGPGDLLSCSPSVEYCLLLINIDFRHHLWC
jgi:hypothetical protein